MKNIKYTEPTSYFPKEIREKFFGKSAKKKAAPAKKTTAKKTVKKSK